MTQFSKSGIFEFFVAKGDGCFSTSCKSNVLTPIDFAMGFLGAVTLKIEHALFKRGGHQGIGDKIPSCPLQQLLFECIRSLLSTPGLFQRDI